MQLKMYSIRDLKSEVYKAPFYKKTHGEAERDFKTAVNDPQSGSLNQYPEDYDLFFVGEYDDNTGKILPLDIPQHVAKAISLKTPVQ